MDMMTTGVAGRTRSKTESFMRDEINKAKKNSVGNQSGSSQNSREERQKRRASIRNACSPPPPPANSKRRRKRPSEDDDGVEFIRTIKNPEDKREDENDVEFIEIINPEGKREVDDDVECLGTINSGGKRDGEHVEDDNVGSASVIAPSLESRSPNPDRDCDFAVDDANSKGEKETSILTPSSPDDDDVVFLGTTFREKDHVEESNVDMVIDFSVNDANSSGEKETSPLPPSAPDDDDDDDEDDEDVVFMGTIPREQEDVDDTDLRAEEKTSTLGISESDDVVSLSSGEEGSMEELETGSSDEDADSDSSDYIKESSDSSYSESSESDFDDCSEDEEAGSARDTAKGRKSSNEKVYTGEKRKRKRKTSPIENNLDLFDLLAKSIWERTKIFEEEDICSGDETAEAVSREDPIVRESVGEKVYEQRKRKRSHREKEKNHTKVDVSFDGGETLWETPPLNLRFGCDCEDPKPIEKTEEEEEIDNLWADMALALTLEGVHSSTPFKKGDVPCINGKHDFVLDEEIGLKCLHCSYVSVEIRDISPAMDKNRSNVYEKKTRNDRKGETFFNGLEFEASDKSSHVASLDDDDTQGTVWEYVPGVKDTLYPHQQEGFEFIWKNLAGTTKLDKLKSSAVKESGGCIMSHSPGTGKTRLTIVFLQSYLERFPDSHPVVIAPASLMLTWEEEFKKWNANIPFYNMSNQEFSGQEIQSAVAHLKGNKNHRSNKHSVRMVKLYSWRNKKSILGVSYNLYEKLASNKYASEKPEFGKMLLELPGLMVLDEGHTPRNQNSRIWQVLCEVKTEKRIILSGTPFQNNFKELSNVLCLARPAYKDKISSRLQDLSKLSQEGKNGRFDEEVGIMELKDMIAPFVHVHKGNILRESLPGLRDSVVVLNPPFIQEKILNRIDPAQNTFELEHKLSAVSVHPSLYLCCNPTKKEDMFIGQRLLTTLDKIKLDSKEGAKTRFLIDFIRLSETLKEKVLVFSQYIDTLKLISDQLSAVFRWTEGEEILFMHGQLEQKDRQHLINNFNKPDSASKVLLASTKSCSEGINLVGASRVVLLDVVWNPSVERQAISRAYRIGQKRVVYTYHLMVKGTSEWGKYCKQTKKHRISEMVFTSTDENDKLINNEVVSEDRILDEMVRHEKLKDMFEKILNRPKESDMFTNIL
uniref:SNF2 domain-containing protein CLASSY 4 n=2 Tax=Noccaea caerulescens TaxID=107243 RepID=A0A1J3GDY4_NOCCA